MTSPEPPVPSDESITDPIQLIDAHFEQLELLCELFIDGFTDVVAATANELQSLEQKPRFTDSTAVFNDHLRERSYDTDIDSIVESLDGEQIVEVGSQFLGTLQQGLLLQALEQSDDATDHLILMAAVQILLDGLAAMPNQSQPDREELLSSQLAMLSKLYELTQLTPPELTDDAILDIAIAEYHFYRVTAERFDRHPDTVPVQSIAPDLAVYGAAVAHDTFGVSTERAAVLANEAHDEFIDLLASYGIDPDE